MPLRQSNAPPTEQPEALPVESRYYENLDIDDGDVLRYFVPLPQTETRLIGLQRRPFILVVDDDRCIGELLSELLMESGFRVEVAYDGDSAFAVACQDTPALILSDFMMPDCDGERLAHRLRDNPSTHLVPVALMSSARPRLSGLEGVPFLPKPFDIDEVLVFVNRYARPPQTDLPHGEG